MGWGFQWRPYVPVARRKANGKAAAVKIAKKEGRVAIELIGRNIANSFWGKAWCSNLEQYSDYSNRLPRGRTYVRNGSVIDLQISQGKIKALVSGSELYRVTIEIKTLPSPVWSQIKKDCAHSIDSMIDLLQGKFDQGIMKRLSQCDGGLFPRPKEIKMSCSCPDSAGMCKHIAATMYGVGARLDSEPELLFTLRDVDHLELVGQAVDADNLSQTLQGKSDGALSGSDLGAIFGIDLESGSESEDRRPEAPTKKVKSRSKSKPTEAVASRLQKGKKTSAAPRKRKAAASS